jgi:hypothetical protein
VFRFTHILLPPSFQLLPPVVTYGELHIHFSFGDAPIFSLLYTELLSWSVLRSGGFGDVHFMYQRGGSNSRIKKMILRTRDNKVLKGLLDSLDNKIADLMVRRGLAQSTNEALSMFQRYTVESDKDQVRGRSRQHEVGLPSMYQLI